MTSHDRAAETAAGETRPLAENGAVGSRVHALANGNKDQVTLEVVPVGKRKATENRRRTMRVRSARENYLAALVVLLALAVLLFLALYLKTVIGRRGKPAGGRTSID